MIQVSLMVVEKYLYTLRVKHALFHVLRFQTMDRSLRVKESSSWIVYPSSTTSPDGRAARSRSTPARPGFAFYPASDDPSSPSSSSWVLEFNVPSSPYSPADHHVKRKVFKMEENADLLFRGEPADVLRLNGRRVASGKRHVLGGGSGRRRCRHFTGVGLGPAGSEGDVAAVTSCADGQTVDKFVCLLRF